MWMLIRKTKTLVNALKPITAGFFLPLFCVPMSKLMHFISACITDTKPWGCLDFYL